MSANMEMMAAIAVGLDPKLVWVEDGHEDDPEPIVREIRALCGRCKEPLRHEMIVLHGVIPTWEGPMDMTLVHRKVTARLHPYCAREYAHA